MGFIEGQQVEIRSEDEGLEDSWFTATITKLPCDNNNDFSIEYDRNLMTDENRPSDPSRRSSVNAFLIRPLPPQEPTNQFFRLQQLVDAFDQNRWWKGEITQILDDSRYTVFFPNSTKEKYMEFGLKDLRVHQDWIDGEWIKAQDQDIETKHNEVDVSKSDPVKGEEQNDSSQTQVQCLEIVPCPLSSIEKSDEQQQCRRVGTRWRCSTKASPGKLYCEKHQLKQDTFNEKRRKGPKKQSQFSTEPPLPSGERRCRRIGTGWRCHEMASPGLYCEKHQLEQYKRRKSAREQIISSDLSIESRGEVLKKLKGRKKSKPPKEASEESEVRKQIITIMEIDVLSKELPSEASAEDPKDGKSPSRELADVAQTECTSEGAEPIDTHVDGMDPFLASDWSFSSTKLNLNI